MVHDEEALHADSRDDDPMDCNRLLHKWTRQRDMTASGIPLVELTECAKLDHCV